MVNQSPKFNYRKVENLHIFVPNFCRMIFVDRKLFFLVLAFVGFAGLGQNAFSAQTTKKTIKKTVRKKGALKKEEKEVISKNLTPAEQQRLSSKKWSFILGTSAFRSRDELSDYFGSVSGSMAYKVHSKLLLTSSLQYEYITYKSGGAFLVNQDNPRNFGFGDLRLGFSAPRIFNLPNIKSFVNFSGGINLPTSTNSLDAGQYYSSNFTVSMISFVTPKFLINSYSSILHAAHQFEEANATGSLLNSPFGLRAGANLSYNLIKGLTAFSGYDLNARFEYSNGVRNIQTFSAGLQYAFTDKIYFSGSTVWRDELISNDVVFDDDKSFYSIGVDYIL